MTYQSGGLALLALATFLVDVWAIVCLIRRPSWAFSNASTSRGLWLLLILVPMLLCNIGFFVSLWYLFIVDPRVRAMQQLGPGIGFPARHRGGAR